MNSAACSDDSARAQVERTETADVHGCRRSSPREICRLMEKISLVSCVSIVSSVKRTIEFDHY
jgi:hypothetical protein